jgi:hypothetical protein
MMQYKKDRMTLGNCPRDSPLTREFYQIGSVIPLFYAIIQLEP